MLNANVEWLGRLHTVAQGVRMAAHGVHMVAQMLLLGALGVAYMAAQRLHMAAHGIHMAAQRLLLGALGAAYGRSEAPNGCPWGCIWLL